MNHFKLVEKDQAGRKGIISAGKLNFLKKLRQEEMQLLRIEF
jgi:hypothetical protein